MKAITGCARMLGVATLALAALTTAGEAARAQSLEDLNPFNSKSPIGRGFRYSCVIANPTDTRIFYDFRGDQFRLPPHSTRRHWGHGMPDISFDDGKNRTIEYTLGHELDVYEFRWKGSRLDLYRKPRVHR